MFWAFMFRCLLAAILGVTIGQALAPLVLI
jgi:hypothetical protein